MVSAVDCYVVVLLLCCHRCLMLLLLCSHEWSLFVAFVVGGGSDEGIRGSN